MNLEFEKNKDHNKLLLSEINQLYSKIKLGGLNRKNDLKNKAQGKMTARERINFLIDNKSPHYEIGAFAGYEMYEDVGGCPSAGVVVVIGYVSGKLCVIVANDSSVKAGSWFPITAKKNLRAQEISIENKIPIIYLVDSAGVYLPMQDEIFPDKYHFGRIFRNNAKMSSKGIIQIAAVMGSCVAGGAYLPIMSDESIIVNKTASIFLAGSYLVKAAIGEEVDNETLGGATTHSEISGITDYKASDDKDALNKIRSLISKVSSNENAGFNRIKSEKPKKNIDEIYGILPRDKTKPYSSFDIIERLIDEDSFDQYKADYGKTIITGYARIDGWAVGIVANERQVGIIYNQREMVKNKKGEIQYGGVIYSDSADKATRFIANCNQRKIPLVFLQDVTGFMVGSNAEHGGIIKDGAKMVNAVANSVVPKFTIIIGNSFGAGNYAMCGKAFDPRLIISWPGAKQAVMGGEQAAKVILQMEKSKFKKINKKISLKNEKELYDKIKAKYEHQSNPTYAASRLWIDAIIDPIETRKWISMGIEMANHSPVNEKFNMGILQV